MASTSGTSKEYPVQTTRQLAQFVAGLEFSTIPPQVVEHLKILFLDYIGVSIFAAKNAESSEPFYKAIKVLDSDSARSTVFTKGSSFQPQYAMLLNGTFSHTLDFDDTHLEGVVHPSCPVVTAALTEAEALGTSGEQFLTAIAAGHEVVCRLGVALGSGGAGRGFHNTSTCGIFDAIAAISSLRGLSTEVTEMALGLGISRTAGCMQYLANGAWNKRLHPGFAAHDAYLAVAFAEAGVLGAEEPIEGHHGLLNLFSSSPNPDGIVDGLGSIWFSEATAIKPYPSCRLTHGPIDLATSMRESSGTRIVNSMKLEISTLGMQLVGKPVPNKMHPKNNVDAQLSAFYQTDVTWLDGSDSGWKIYNRLLDADVAKLSNRINVVEDMSMSDFQARLTVLYEDGSSDTGFCDAPLGETSNPLPLEKITAKYLSLSIPVFGKKKTAEIQEFVSKIEGQKVAHLMALLA